MSAAGELEVNRHNTSAFIAANPTTLILIPRTRGKNAYGVHWSEGAPRVAQTFRIIDQSSQVSAAVGLLRTVDGIQRRVEFLLLGPWDSAVGVYDYWTDTDGLRWEVIELLPRNGYEVRASVSRFGEA